MAEANYWFEPQEFDNRLARVQAELQARGYDALLAFMPETVTWVTGFFTRAYSSFQFAIIPANGQPTLICRDVEAYYLDTTCRYADRVLWGDSDDQYAVAINAIRSRLGNSPHLAVEMDAWPLSVARFNAISSGLPQAQFSDACGLATRMRFIKSAAEIAYQRAAAAAAEAGMAAAIAAAQPGVSEREMAAQICAAMIRAGSDLPGPGVMSSGERAWHLHGGYNDRILRAGDIVQIETTPNVRHYHARFMRPIRVARASDEDQRTVEQLIAIQDAALAEVRPGVPASIPDAIYRDRVLSAGLRQDYTNKTFYSVGLLLAPSGGEPLEAAPGCDWRFEVGQTFHTYVLARGFGMSETLVITDQGYERLTQFPRQLFIS